MQTFDVTYKVAVQQDEQIDEKIEGICLEQSVELPRSVVDPDIQRKVIGDPRQREKIGDNQYEVTIAWPTADVDGDISQFLNLLYGNISLQPGIRVASVEWSALAPEVFGGPAVGVQTIRDRYQIKKRPLSATALKPLGSSPDELADLTFEFASGGIDIIKDDHGLADQDFAPFEERVRACVKAIKKAADQTGHRSYYYPNITAFAPDTVERFQLASELGADGVLICPHIAGLETMHRLARRDESLPIVAHPSFSGTLTTNQTKGLTPSFLYGQLWRALGADFVIYPNKGGRFSFTEAECRAINSAANDLQSPFARAFPMPAGGIKIENVDRWITEYSQDVTFLIGGSLYEHPEGVQAASRELQQKLINNESKS